MRERV